MPITNDFSSPNMLKTTHVLSNDIGDMSTAQKNIIFCLFIRSFPAIAFGGWGLLKLSLTGTVA